MFARTQRLTLRPGWPEDALALARAIGHESVVTKLSRAPWPYTLGDAEAFLTRMRAQDDLFCLIMLHEGASTRLIGGIGIHREDADHEFGYWLTPDAWGRGFATEAGRAVIDNARHTLRLKQLHAGYFIDNPASGRVLSKLGFRPTGKIVRQRSLARGEDVPCARMETDLTEPRQGDKPLMAA
jgi:RimJ/RimL family protein N-acetyltransferase